MCRGDAVLCLSVFLVGCAHQYDETSEFRKEDGKKAFPTLRSVHSNDMETHRLPRNACSYGECQYDQRVFSQLQTGLSDNRSLSNKALYRTLVRGEEYEIWSIVRCAEGEGHLLWPRAIEMTCLIKDVIIHFAGDSERLLRRQTRNTSVNFTRVLRCGIIWRSRSRTLSFTVPVSGTPLRRNRSSQTSFVYKCFGAWIHTALDLRV